MATITHAATATWTTTAGNKTLTATPALGDLIVVIAPATGVATSSVTDNNADGLGTYTKIGSSFTGFSTAGDLSVWVRNALIGSASSTVFTAKQISSTGGGLDVFRVSGMSKTGANAVRGSGGQSTGTASTTPAPVLSNTPLTGNPIITAVANGTSPGGVTGPSTYTAPTNLGYTVPTAGMDTAYVNSGITNATITWGSTSATAFASIAIELDATSTGPPLGWGSPAGVRAVVVRTGIAMASQIPASNPAPPSTGPVFYPAQQAVQAKLPQPPIGAGAFKGRVSSSPGAPVQNPAPGPVFVQKPKPVHYALPPWQPRAGRIGSSFGAPVINPIHGPPVYAPHGPVRPRIPRPFAGLISAFGQANGAISAPVNGSGFGAAACSAGAPVRNPAAGPAFRQATSPARIRPALPPRGRVITGNPGGPVVKPAPVGPVFYPAVQAIRAKPPLRQFPAGLVYASIASPALNDTYAANYTSNYGVVYGFTLAFSTGRVSFSYGAPPQNPAPVPVFRQAVTAIRSRIPQNAPRGRIASSRGAPVQNPAPVVTGPPFFPHQSIRARQPLQPLLRGRVASNTGSPVRNPAAGPAFRQRVQPVRAVVPQAFSKGRASANPGIPVQKPAPGSVFRQATAPARIRPALPPRGRIASNAGAPIRNPVLGAAFPAAHGPVRARFPQFHPRAGRIASNPGTPAYPLRVDNYSTPGAFQPGAAWPGNPVPLAVGPLFRPAVTPARIRVTLPPRGRIASNPGGPVQNPAPGVTGPPFFPFRFPSRAKIPQNAPRGRVLSNPGGPVHNPGQGPVFRPPVHPVRAAIPQAFSKGRASGNPGIPVPSPAPASVFYPVLHPVRAPAQVPRRGRTASSAGAPVSNPQHGGTFPAWHGPVRAPVPRPWSKGRTSGTGALPPPVAGHATLPVGLTLTAGPESAWQYIGPVPLTYLQYEFTAGGTLVVSPGETTEMDPASGYPYQLAVPPPDGRWIVAGSGMDLFAPAPPRRQEEAPADDSVWIPPPHLAHLPPQVLGFLAAKELKKRRQERGEP